MAKNVTISVSNELATKMERFHEVNWSEVCRQAIGRYIEEKEPKGELIEGLGKYLSGKIPKLDKEKVKKMEIERFTKKWGIPDYKTVLEVEHPYVGLQKNHQVNLGDKTITELEISNSRVLASGVGERIKKGFGKYNIELYKNLEPLVDYFKSKNFAIEETNLIQAQVMRYVLKIHGSKGRELWRGLIAKGYQYYGLFVADKEDYIFIAYRQVEQKPQPPKT